MRARVGFARQAHNRAVFSPQFTPVGVLAAVNGRDLFHGQGINWVFTVDDHRNGILCNYILFRLKSKGLRLPDFLFRNDARGIGQVNGIVHQG